MLLWGIASSKPRPDLMLPGSPERCVKRAAFEDDEGRLWMLERLFPDQRERRERIGALLHYLSKQGLPVPAYRRCLDGGFVAECDGYHWQLSPFVPGDSLPQPEYVDHEERGISLGKFLADLHHSVQAYPRFAPEPDISYAAYSAELLATLAPRNHGLYKDLFQVRETLVPLFDAWEELPSMICHGDFHPLNVIWQGRDVAAVVDWEFAGVRPILYDVANCLGCVGIEDPHAFGCGLAPGLLRTLRNRGGLTSRDMVLLPEMLIAIRFAWMSEWLRRRDRPMQELELRYMKLLVANREKLRALFQHASAGSEP